LNFYYISGVNIDDGFGVGAGVEAGLTGF